MYKTFIILGLCCFFLSCQQENNSMKETISDFKIIGISIETTNENGKSMEDLGKLWNDFYSLGISDKIPNKTSEEVYSLFTNYESDYTGKYTAIIGHKVANLDNIPDGFLGKEFKGGTYSKFIAKGKMPDAIINIWGEIWKKDKELHRRYTVDFEVYGPASQNGENSEVTVFIATE